jgi:hypothetical protein
VAGAVISGRPVCEIRLLSPRQSSRQLSRLTDASLSCGSNCRGSPNGYARFCHRLYRQIQIQLADRRWQMYVNERTGSGSGFERAPGSQRFVASEWGASVFHGTALATGSISVTVGGMEDCKTLRRHEWRVCCSSVAGMNLTVKW